jgi:adenosylcobinamide-phosphate guanylyltransferase
MYALILAGGEGSRLGRGEKGLVSLGGKPMIRWVAEAFLQAGCDVVAVLSHKTPYTCNWCRAQGIFHYTAEGRGYIEDIVETVEALELTSPLFTCGTDLPLLAFDTVKLLMEKYAECQKDALSVWVPRKLAEEYGYEPPCTEIISGVSACPAGINILRGDLIATQQEEERVLIEDPRLACNVNTRESLAKAEWILNHAASRS